MRWSISKSKIFRSCQRKWYLGSIVANANSKDPLRREAYILVSICPDFRLHMYQMCAGLGRLMTTVGAEFPKEMLP